MRDSYGRGIFDVAVIGGGLLGCFCALNLSRCSLSTILLEKREDVCTGISKANTAIIYPGYDNHPGSLKTNLTLKANRELPDLCQKLHVPFLRCGSVMVGTGPNGDNAVQKKYRQGVENRVPGLKLLSAQEIRRLEPGLTPGITLGLYAPSTATLHPWELGIAAFEAAKELGCQTRLRAEVTAIRREKDCFCLEIGHTFSLRSRMVVNCAGILADQVQALYQEPLIRIRPELAEYVLFEPKEDGALKHIVFYETEEKGKGISLVPTRNRKILAGTKNRPADAFSSAAVSAEGIQEILKECKMIYPALDSFTPLRSFAGLRPNPYYPASPQSRLCGLEPLITDTGDGLISLIGIKTPGLTCANELGMLIRDKALDFLNIGQADIREIPPPRRHAEYLEDPAYQKIICRCEGITLGEILEAVERGAVTIDGVKRRTGSGMGLCQGSYCSARIAEILSRKLSVFDGQITKDGRNSYYFSHNHGGNTHA